MTERERDYILSKICISTFGEKFVCVYRTNRICRCLTCKYLNFVLEILAEIANDKDPLPYWGACDKSPSDCPKIDLEACNYCSKSNSSNCEHCDRQRVSLLDKSGTQNYLTLATTTPSQSHYSVYGGKLIQTTIFILSHMENNHSELDYDSKEKILKLILLLIQREDIAKVKSKINKDRVLNLREVFREGRSLEDIDEKLASECLLIENRPKFFSRHKEDDFIYVHFLKVLQAIINNRGDDFYDYINNYLVVHTEKSDTEE